MTMKRNLFTITGVLAIALALVFGLAGCDNDPDGSGPGGSSSWTAVSDSTFGSNAINGVAYGNSKWVAVGIGNIVYSSDGTSWTAVSGSSGSFNGVAYGNDKWVAVGDSSKRAYSSDGTSWTAVNDSIFDYTNTISNTVFSSNINGVAYGNNKWGAVGRFGKRAYSSDGTSWTAVSDSIFNYIESMPDDDITGVAYGNSKWVAVGSSGKMAYSSDGTSWTAVSDSTFGSNAINGVAYGNSKWVAVGIGNIVYSSDGTSWTAVSGSTFGSNAINGVAYGNGKWVAVGASGKMAYCND